MYMMYDVCTVLLLEIKVEKNNSTDKVTIKITIDYLPIGVSKRNKHMFWLSVQRLLHMLLHLN